MALSKKQIAKRLEMWLLRKQERDLCVAFNSFPFEQEDAVYGEEAVTETYEAPILKKKNNLCTKKEFEEYEKEKADSSIRNKKRWKEMLWRR